MKQTHRFLVTCYKMDTQEQRRVTYTRRMTSNGRYGCSKCKDDRNQLAHPTRVSFHYPRSIDDVREIAHSSCKKYTDWEKSNEKNQGYKATDEQIWMGKHQFDPFYIICQDLDHGAFNLAQQFSKTLSWNDEVISEELGKPFFAEMLDISQMNHMKPALGPQNWDKKKKVLCDLTLELSPICLVT